jgi:hypothetical protein
MAPYPSTIPQCNNSSLWSLHNGHVDFETIAPSGGSKKKCDYLYLVRRRRRLNKKRQKRPNGNHCVFARRAYVLVTRNTFVITLLISKCTWSTSPTRKCIGRHPRGMRWWWWCCGGRVISEMYPTNRPLSRVKNIEVIVVIEEQSKCFFSL